MKYAGVGSRATPHDILAKMRDLASELEDLGYICRTGGALGADKAFIDGTKYGDNLELYLPFPGYNGYKSDLPGVTQTDIDFASKYHPNWKACDQTARKMHGRNCNIVLGSNLDDPVHFIVCWTKNAKVSGGTGMALRLAIDYDIPVFNLGSKRGADKVINDLRDYLKEIISI